LAAQSCAAAGALRDQGGIGSAFGRAHPVLLPAASQGSRNARRNLLKKHQFNKFKCT
jgi:hypothetical protein